MAEPFLSEIRMVGFTFAPRGWAFCNGHILPINQNQSLYSLLGTTYGGDGRTSFALPDLLGRTPIHAESIYPNLGAKGGEENHTLTLQEIPSHRHAMNSSGSEAAQVSPVNAFLAPNSFRNYTRPGARTELKANVLNTGGGQGHDNMQPYLAINFCIALQGVFPSRN